jgi:hypothetical protein
MRSFLKASMSDALRRRPLRLGLGQGGAGKLDGIKQCILMVRGPPATMIVVSLHDALQFGTKVSH